MDLVIDFVITALREADLRPNEELVELPDGTWLLIEVVPDEP